MKYSKFLIHYNKNHDKLGRFARSIGGGSADTVVKKGTKFRRVTGSIKEDSRDSVTYVSNSKIDRKLYTSETGSVFGSFNGPSYSHKLKTRKDIKVAGKQAQAESFARVLDKASPKQLVDHTQHLDTGINPELKKYVKDPDLKRLYQDAKKNQKSFDLAFEVFTQNIDTRDKLTSDFINDLKSRGYGALHDEYDTKYKDTPGKVNYYDPKTGIINGTVINANSAMIFLDRNENLKTVKVNSISKRDIARAEKWLRRKGYVQDVLEK